MRRWTPNKEELLFLIKLNRPIGIPLISLVILAGSVSHAGLSIGVALNSLVLSILICYIGFGPNDYIDRKTDERNPRKGGWQGAKAVGSKARIAKYASICAVTLSVIVSFILPTMSGLSLLGITLTAILYSVPPVRLKSVPILDSISNAVMAYLAFCLGVGLVGGGFESVIPGAFWFSLIFAGGGHAIGTLLDLEPDKEAGISTIGIFLGWEKTIALIQVLIAAALVLEKWSIESKIFLIITFLGLLAPAYNNHKETLEKSIYLGLLIYVIYGIIWLYLRV